MESSEGQSIGMGEPWNNQSMNYNLLVSAIRSHPSHAPWSHNDVINAIQWHKERNGWIAYQSRGAKTCVFMFRKLDDESQKDDRWFHNHEGKVLWVDFMYSDDERLALMALRDLVEITGNHVCDRVSFERGDKTGIHTYSAEFALKMARQYLRKIKNEQS